MQALENIIRNKDKELARLQKKVRPWGPGRTPRQAHPEGAVRQPHACPVSVAAPGGRPLAVQTRLCLLIVMPLHSGQEQRTCRSQSKSTVVVHDSWHERGGGACAEPAALRCAAVGRRTRPTRCPSAAASWRTSWASPRGCWRTPRARSGCSTQRAAAARARWPSRQGLPEDHSAVQHPCMHAWRTAGLAKRLLPTASTSGRCTHGACMRAALGSAGAGALAASAAALAVCLYACSPQPLYLPAAGGLLHPQDSCGMQRRGPCHFMTHICL